MKTHGFKMKHSAAVRALVKLTDIRTGPISEAHECDRHFDGGEWSDAAYGNSYEEVYQKSLIEVATKFGVPKDELDDEIDKYNNGAFIPDAVMEAWSNNPKFY